MTLKNTLFSLMILMLTFSASSQIVFNSSFESGEKSTSPLPVANIIKLPNAHEDITNEPALEESLTNLIKNGSFEGDAKTTWFSCTAASVVDGGSEGKKSLEISGNTDCNALFYNHIYGQRLAQDDIKLDPNQEYYTLSFDLKYNTWVNQTLEPKISFSFANQNFTALKSYVKKNFEFDTQPLTQGWHEFRFVIDKSNLKKYITNWNDVSLTFTFDRINTSANPRQKFYIDNIRLVAGSFPFGGKPFRKMPNTLKQSKDVLITTTNYQGTFYTGTMQANGKKNLIYKNFPQLSYAKPRALNGNITQASPVPIPAIAKPPIVQGRGLSVNIFDLAGNKVKNIDNFVGLSGYYNKLDPVDNQQNGKNALLQEYQVFITSDKQDRAISAACSTYYHPLGIKNNSVACLGFMRTKAGKAIKDAKGNPLFFKGSSFSITPKGTVVYGRSDDGLLSLSNVNMKKPISYYSPYVDATAAANQSERVAVLYNRSGGGKVVGDKISLFSRLVIYDVTDGEIKSGESFVFNTLWNKFAWSKDDKYIYFSTEGSRVENGKKITDYDIWWLDVETGESGLLSNTNATAGKLSVYDVL